MLTIEGLNHDLNSPQLNNRDYYQINISNDIINGPLGNPIAHDIELQGMVVETTSTSRPRVLSASTWVDVFAGYEVIEEDNINHNFQNNIDGSTYIDIHIPWQTSEIIAVQFSHEMDPQSVTSPGVYSLKINENSIMVNDTHHNVIYDSSRKIAYIYGLDLYDYYNEEFTLTVSYAQTISGELVHDSVTGEIFNKCNNTN